ncbi:MAG: hypothetical protein H0T68_14955, partial [Gemmatimonadales bacterium]|nr:hypothetical protein [Gemmatimonadales bacterium]
TGALALSILLSGACADADRLGPTAEATAAPTAAAPAAVVLPGVVFASSKMEPSQLNSVHTGVWAPSTPSQVLSYLSAVRAKGGRAVIVLVGDGVPRNSDNTFNLARWKSALDRYRGVDFSSYIADGTLLAHRLIDEPHFASRWGDKVVPQTVVEEAAKYSKQLWPTLPTMVSSPPNWLAAALVTYTHLDAGLALFRSKTSSSPSRWVALQASKAKQKGLGMFAGLNVLDGGDGSSGWRGTQPGTWQMSASEVRSYGSALLAENHVCGFFMWRYASEYYNRADVKSAMTDLSGLARNHVKTSCRQ